jgi:predicted XRE-type DNA-binding protein
MIIYNYNNEESSNDMNSEKLQNLILNSVYKKSISQRDLARLSGISRNTLNDILNGKIKKSS